MPRNISSALLDHYSGSTLTLTYLVKIVRKDGVILTFTTLDIPIVYEGLTYISTGSITSTAIKSSSDTGVDNLMIQGLMSGGINSELITPEDIRSGRYDEAEVLIRSINYRDLSMGHIILLRGFLGKIVLKDGEYTAEVRALTSRLKQNIGEITSPTCRCRRLGDGRCKFNLAGNLLNGSPAVRNMTVSFANSPTVFVVSDTVSLPALGWYDYGLVLFTSGQNNQVEREIKSVTHDNSTLQTTIYLRQGVLLSIAVGDTLTLTVGCDRTWPTCVNKIGNEINFHGEPHLPGNDTIIQYARPPK